MNLNTLASLVRDDITTCGVKLEGSRTIYTFKVTKELASVLEADHQVVVETVHGFAVGTVVSIHPESQLDPESEFDYRWAISLVDTAMLEANERVEEAIVEKLKIRRKASHKQQALAALGISDPSSLLDGLPTYHAPSAG